MCCTYQIFLLPLRTVVPTWVAIIVETMKRKIVYVLWLAVLLSLNTTTAQNLTPDPTVQNLTKCYSWLCNDSCYEAYRNYFDSFPSTFGDFRKIFGYEELANGEIKYGELYSESIHYITKFFQMNSKIPLNDFAEKVIRLCIDGNWQSDGVNYLHMNVVNIVTSSIPYQDCYYNSPEFQCYNDTLKDALLFQLVQHNGDDILSFWQFYLDHSFAMPVDNDLYHRAKSIIRDYPILTRQLDEAYSNLQSRYAP